MCSLIRILQNFCYLIANAGFRKLCFSYLFLFQRGPYWLKCHLFLHIYFKVFSDNVYFPLLYFIWKLVLGFTHLFRFHIKFWLQEYFTSGNLWQTKNTGDWSHRPSFLKFINNHILPFSWDHVHHKLISKGHSPWQISGFRFLTYFRRELLDQLVYRIVCNTRVFKKFAIFSISISFSAIWDSYLHNLVSLVWLLVWNNLFTRIRVLVKSGESERSNLIREVRVSYHYLFRIHLFIIIF